MDNKKTLVIFGAEDHEEQLARQIAKKAGCMIATATYQGKPVHAGNAYKATGYRLDSGSSELPENIILFECGEESIPENWREKIRVIRCDHHNPGDPGYNRGPEDYWIGSSLGQLIDWLAMHMESYGKNREVFEYTAAGDHCPAAAYAGQCPGIDPDKFLTFRIAQKAQFNLGKDATWEELDEETHRIRKAITHAQYLLEEAAGVPGPINGIYDMRAYGEIDELREAALASGGCAYITRIPELNRERKPTGNYKVVLGGHTTPEQVSQFMCWADYLCNKLDQPYGNQDRGYAGVVVADRFCPACKAEFNKHYMTCPECGRWYPRNDNWA